MFVFGIFTSEVTVMKTALVAHWVVVEGRLELQWSIKDDDRAIEMSRWVSPSPKAA
jgi:hypothetical protein